MKSPAIGINFDTGNSYLCGHDPYAWLERVADRLVHLHAKDISAQQSTSERGKVTGTPVGCACGDGVIDWSRVVGHLPQGPSRHRLLGRVRHRRPGRPVGEASSGFDLTRRLRLKARQWV